MATNGYAGGRWHGLTRNAFVRLVAMAVGLMVWLVGYRAFVTPALRGLGESGTFIGDSARLLGAAIYAAGALLLYTFLVKKIEGRQPIEIARQPGARLFAQGLVIGLALCFAVIGAILLLGGAEAASDGSGDRLVAQFSAALMASVAEELLFRAVMFRILEQALGTLRALLISALFFGLAHIVNPDATLASSLVISLESGVMLGLAFVATRNLWFPIGIHLAWNFAQGGIFGAANGDSPSGLIRLDYSGPAWMTGGASGPEMSAITVAFCIALALALAVKARRSGRWLPARLKLQLD